MMVPEFPAPTNIVELSVVVVVDLLLLQEMMVRLKSKRERMMSRCFTWFPNRLILGEPNIYHDLGVFYKEVGRFPQRTPNLRNIILLTDIVSAYTETLRKY